MYCPKSLRALFSGLLLLPLLASTPSAAGAAEGPAYPERPVVMVVPFTPGGGTDIVAKLIAHQLELSLGQPLVTEYKPGANGLVALQYVNQRPADGYTLLFGSNSTHVISPLLSKEKSMMADTLRDFDMVGVVANTTLVLAVGAKSPIKTLADYLRMTKARSVTYGTFGLGSSPHLMGELLASRQKVRLLHVPYKGSAPAVADLMGGHIDSVFLTVAAVSGHIASGDLRALAVTGAKRIPSLPAVPTFGEAGAPGLEDAGWFAVFAPARTPAPIMDKLRASLEKIVAEPAMQKRLIELGLDPASGNGAQHKAIWMRTVETTENILKASSIQPQ